MPRWPCRKLRGVHSLGNLFENRSAWRWRRDVTAPSSSVQPLSADLSSSSAEFSLLCGAAVPGLGLPDCAFFELQFSLERSLAAGCASVETQFPRKRVPAGGWASNYTRHGLQSGVNRLLVTAVDEAGNRQAPPAEYSWRVALAADSLEVAITAGPPARSAWGTATFQLYAHAPGAVERRRAVFETRLGAGAAWVRDEAVRYHPATWACNYSLSGLRPGAYLLQARFPGRCLRLLSLVPQPPVGLQLLL